MKAWLGAILSTILLQQGSILQPILQPQPTGGGGSISLINSTSCYPATTCTLGSISSGDLVFAYIGDNAADTLSCTSGCSSSAAFGTPYNDASANANHIGGMWGIANTTSVTFGRATGSGSDTGITLIDLHTTTTWNTSSFVQGTPATAPNDASGTSLTLPATTPTSTTNAASCFVLQESAGFTTSGTTLSFLAGPAATGHSDASVYRLNIAAATYTPVMTVSGSGIGYGAMCGAMGIN